MKNIETMDGQENLDRTLIKNKCATVRKIFKAIVRDNICPRTKYDRCLLSRSLQYSTGFAR